MNNNIKIILIFSLIFLSNYSCYFKDNTILTKKEKNKPQKDLYKEPSNTYTDFKLSNLELPEFIFLDKGNYIDILDKKSNNVEIILTKNIIWYKIVKEKNIFIYCEENKIVIFNYVTKEKLFIYFEKSENFKDIFITEKIIITTNNRTFYLDTLNYKIIELFNFEIFQPIFYDSYKNMLFIMKKNNETILCLSDFKNNIIELSKIDLKTQASYSISRKNDKIAFLYDQNMYYFDIESKTKIKILEKSEKIDIYSPPLISPDNKYILFYISDNMFRKETHLINLYNPNTNINSTSNSFVGYGTTNDIGWLDNYTFVFNSFDKFEDEIGHKNLPQKVKFDYKEDKFTFVKENLLDNSSVLKEDNTYLNNLKSNFITLDDYKDYIFTNSEVSSNKENLAITFSNIIDDKACKDTYIRINSEFCNNKTKKYGFILYIYNFYLKNSIEILKDSNYSFTYLPKFKWSKNNKFLYSF
ncbi:MAG: hypothetical protein U0457_13270 [Candidatus Sericytochromatia bacterium]